MNYLISNYYFLLATDETVTFTASSCVRVGPGRLGDGDAHRGVPAGGDLHHDLPLLAPLDAPGEARHCLQQRGVRRARHRQRRRFEAAVGGAHWPIIRNLRLGICLWC